MNNFFKRDKPIASALVHSFQEYSALPLNTEECDMRKGLQGTFSECEDKGEEGRKGRRERGRGGKEKRVFNDEASCHRLNATTFFLSIEGNFMFQSMAS